jgi:GT2 family glycosyltransferase
MQNGDTKTMGDATARPAKRPVDRGSKPSVAAVVVTFNRKYLLLECLDALLGQTEPLDRIIVVDQASTDGTTDLLVQRGYLSSPLIQYSRSDVNSGGAGGFSRGIELAFQGRFDWIWIMDDDAIAEPNTLRRTLEHAQVPDIVGIANAKLRVDGTLDDGHFVIDRNFSVGPAGPIFLTFSSFVGLMVSRSAVSRVGYPKSELFLQGDDTEYCRRLCRAGRIVFAHDAPLLHKEVSRPPELTRRFGRSFTVYPTDRFCFQYFLWRNRVWIETHDDKIRLGRIGWLLGKIGRVLVRTCVIDRQDLSTRMFVLAKAIWDGMAGRFDNEFPFRMRQRVLDKAARTT